MIDALSIAALVACSLATGWSTRAYWQHRRDRRLIAQVLRLVVVEDEKDAPAKDEMQ